MTQHTVKTSGWGGCGVMLLVCLPWWVGFFVMVKATLEAIF